MGGGGNYASSRGDNRSFDTQGKFMRDIVTANNAVELAISNEQHSSNMQSSNDQNASYGSNVVSERRVKTAERGTRSGVAMQTTGSRQPPVELKGQA